MKNKLSYFYYKHKASLSNNKIDCIVLNYHGLIERFSDPILERNFHLYKSFEEQIRYLNQKFQIINTAEFYFKIQNNLPFKNNLLITFDDGYVNNLVAREILDKIDRRLSLSIFVSAGSIGSQEESIWTVNLSLLVLKGNRKELVFEGQNLDISNDHLKNIYFKIIRNKLKKLKKNERILVYNALIAQFENSELATLLHQFPQFKLLDWDQCIQLISNNTEIESHGFNHEILHSHQTKEAINFEAKNSRKLLYEKLGSYPIAFAYPNGDNSETAIEILKNNSYKLAFTTQEGLYNPNNSEMLINRISTPNNIGSFYKMISNFT